MGFADEWKKHKPKTLLKDPLTAPLQALDKALADAEVGSVRAATNAHAAAGKVLVALADTKKLCNATLHKDGIKWLTDREKGVATLQSDLIDRMKTQEKSIKEIRKERDSLNAAYDAFAGNPDSSHTASLEKALKSFISYLNSFGNDNKLYGDEAISIQKFAAAGLAGIEKYAAVASAAAKAPPEKIDKLKAEKSERLKDIEAQRKKIFLIDTQIINSSKIA